MPCCQHICELSLIYYILSVFQAQSDDDEVDEVQVGADTGGFMDEFFAQVSCLLYGVALHTIAKGDSCCHRRDLTYACVSICMGFDNCLPCR